MAEKEKKSCVVGIRFTTDQYAPFAGPIAESGVKPAKYFRDLVLSRSPKFEHSAIDQKKMLIVFENSGHALNRVAHLANSAPFKGALYQKKYLQWLRRLVSIQILLQSVLPVTDPPVRARGIYHGNRGSPVDDCNKVISIFFRLTPGEHSQFDHLIKRANCTASFFFRELILSNAPTFRQFTGFKKRVVFLVNKAGNNITQLAYIANAASDRSIISDAVKDRWLAALVSIEALMLAGIEYAD